MTRVFIVGQHRTGSTWLKNILDAHSSVVMAFDEMNLYEPFRKDTLSRLISRGDTSSHQIVDAIFSKRVYGTFWQDINKSGLTKHQLSCALGDRDRLTERDVLDAVLVILQSFENKSFVGAKYPVHVSKMARLLDWFPDSKVIFITRDPSSIIASKLNDSATIRRKKISVFHRFFIHYFTLIYFCFEFRISVKTYFSNKDKVFKLSYEELLVEPERAVRRLCDYVGLTFEREMLESDGKPSSHKLVSRRISNSGVYASALNRFDRILISLLTRSFFRRIRD